VEAGQPVRGGRDRGQPFLGTFQSFLLPHNIYLPCSIIMQSLFTVEKTIVLLLICSAGSTILLPFQFMVSIILREIKLRKV
jgi:hypothetical protein